MEAEQSSWGFTPEVTHMVTHLSFLMLYMEDVQYCTALVLDVCVQGHVCGCVCVYVSQRTTSRCRSSDSAHLSFLRHGVSLVWNQP